MYQFIGVDQPREQYAELVRTRDQDRLERQVARVARDVRRTRPRRGRLAWRFLGRRRVAPSQMVGGVAGA